MFRRLASKVFFLSAVLVAVVCLSVFTAYVPAADAATSGDASITVLSPNGNEVWEAGSRQTITWAYTGDPGSQVNIFLGDIYNEPGWGGGTTKVIGLTSVGQNGRGSYTFTVPSDQRPGGTYRVRVQSDTKTLCFDSSDDRFHIVRPGGQPAITVVSPNGGEAWAPGSTQTIRWRYTGELAEGDKVDIYIVKIHSNTTVITYYKIGEAAIGQNGTGSYTWKIPLNYKGSAKIAVVSKHNRFLRDTSDGFFGIDSAISTPVPSTTAENSITVVSPNGGEAWTEGSQQTIRWTYTGNLGSQVEIYLNRIYSGVAASGKIAVTSIGQNGTGSYTWSIPQYTTPTDKCRIVVKSIGDKPCSDQSNDYFKIIKPMSQQTDQVLPDQQPPLEQQPPAQPQPPQQAGQVLIDDPSFVTLTAIPNPASQADIAYNLQVKANNPAHPVEVSYLLLNPNGTPQNPSLGMEVHPAGEFESTWGSAKQYFYHTEVGGWAQPQYKPNPQIFGLPHYRTAVLMLARYEKLYVVFLRENDGQLTCQVFQGGAFNGLDVPGLGKVTRTGSQFEVLSHGGPVEVGIWDKGQYKHDEVKGWAQPGYAANPKRYDIPNYGMFMLAVGRYDKLGLIIGNMNDGQLGTICVSGSKLLGELGVPDLYTVRKGGVAQIQLQAIGQKPVEVSHFAFDNTCWQWEVNGWAREEFKPNPQILPIRHYTPGFIMASRYDKAGIFFYNENDGQIGVLPLTSGMMTGGAPPAPQQPAQPSVTSSPGITVLLNGQALSFDQPPVIINDRTVVPLRAIFEALGAEVNWDGASQSVTATRGDTVIILAIGSPTAFKDGETVTLSQPALLLGGRTMVPLRFVSEALGAEVNWDGATQTISILHLH